MNRRSARLGFAAMAAVATLVSGTLIGAGPEAAVASTSSSASAAPTASDLENMPACPSDITSRPAGTAAEAATLPMNNSTMCRFTGSGTALAMPSRSISAPVKASSSPVVQPAVAINPNCNVPPSCAYQTGIQGGANFWGVGSDLGIAIPGFTPGYANNQWYSNWVGVQNSLATTNHFIQIGWQWINGQTNYVFVQEWFGTTEEYGQAFTQWNLQSGRVSNITVRLQTSGNNIWYPFLLWGGAWVNVGGAFNTGFSGNQYGEVVSEGSVQNGAPVPTLPTETDSGNIYIPAGSQTYYNWPAGTGSFYTPPYCLNSSAPWTSFNTWEEPGNHC